eukprot:76636_1
MACLRPGRVVCVEHHESDEISIGQIGPQWGAIISPPKLSDDGRYFMDVVTNCRVESPTENDHSQGSEPCSRGEINVVSLESISIMSALSVEIPDFSACASTSRSYVNLINMCIDEVNLFEDDVAEAITNQN